MHHLKYFKHDSRVFQFYLLHKQLDFEIRLKVLYHVVRILNNLSHRNAGFWKKMRDNSMQVFSYNRTFCKIKSEIIIIVVFNKSITGTVNQAN